LKAKAYAVSLADFPGLADETYFSCVSDIFDCSAFLQLGFLRHHNATILDHSVRVSWLSWRICAALGWNAREAARSGLLHDFFLYDWHDADDPRKPDSPHAFAHPVVALENASRHFDLTPREANGIVRHMWPVTPVPPRYKEAWVITLVDKLVATGEFSRLAASLLLAFFGVLVAKIAFGR
jgi:uncharacterized protein